MPHGDFSDLTSLFFFIGGITAVLAPEYALMPLGPLKGVFDGKVLSAEEEMLVKLAGSLMAILGCMLFTVRWNTVNGKLSGFAMTMAGVNFLVMTYKSGSTFVPRTSSICVFFFIFGGLQLMFRANRGCSDKYCYKSKKRVA